MDLSTSHSYKDFTIKEEAIEYINDNKDNDQLKKEGISVDDFIDDLLYSSGTNIEGSQHQNYHSKGKENDIHSNLDNKDNYNSLFCKKNPTLSAGDINQNNRLENINTITNMSLSVPSTSRQGNFADYNNDRLEIESNAIILSTPSNCKDENKKFNNKITGTDIINLKHNVEKGLTNSPKHGNGKNILKCSKCNKEFNGSVKAEVLYEHIMSHIKGHEDNLNANHFKIKGVVELVKTFFSYEKEKVSIPKEDKYSCPICGKVFPSVRSMNSHQAMHTNYKRYTCSKCYAKFKLESDFKVHQYICINNTSNEDSITYICPECDAVFQSKEVLIQHMNLHTKITITPPLPYKCSLCDIYFELLSGLALHQKLMHNSIKKSEIRKNIISCHECGERFNRKCEKRRHMVHCVESEKKDFKCNQCDMKFKRRDGLHLHKSILHK